MNPIILIIIVIIFYIVFMVRINKVYKLHLSILKQVSENTKKEINNYKDNQPPKNYFWRYQWFQDTFPSQFKMTICFWIPLSYYIKKYPVPD